MASQSDPAYEDGPWSGVRYRYVPGPVDDWLKAHGVTSRYGQNAGMAGEELPFTYWPDLYWDLYDDDE